MPLQATSGAASYDAFGGGVAVVPAYIEEVFSCFLYTGTAASLTITNNIDLSTKGGLTWIKGRSGATGHRLTDTARGVTKSLESNSTAAEATEATGLTAFGTTGFTIGADADYNTSAATYTSWTFREQPKFFDVVTYTGTGSARTVAHNLGSVPGMIIVKSTSGSGRNWAVWHRSLGSNNDYLWLESTAAKASSSAYWNNTAPTSTEFTVGGAGNTNEGSETYVAYLFAHDAGGFGLTGTDNVISCGSFTTDGSGNATVSLGYEPQFVLYKKSSTTGQWYIEDTMRGLYGTSTQGTTLIPNLSNAEGALNGSLQLTSTGFTVNPLGNLGTSTTSIYIAIRRGPMKVPTTGTSVFSPNALTTAPATFNIGFPLDLIVNQARDGGQALWGTRLQGPKQYLDSSSTAAEVTAGTAPWAFDKQNDSYAYYTPISVAWNFRRAPSFFDEVCWTATGSTQTLNHNLAVVPEIIITKKRIDNTGSGSAGWIVMSSAYTGGFISGGLTSFGQLQSSAAVNIGAGGFLASTPTSTTFTLLASNYGATNSFVAYLFATCAGVSKVGSYTGTGTTKQIDCGFTAGARFVLIKRTDSTGDWYVWDSARGIIAGNDPYLLINSIAAEVTSTDYIDTYSAGFEISSTAPAAINASGGSFIFLAIS